MVKIVPNDNAKEREDSRGRIRVSHRRTWMIVVDGEFRSEHKTKREAEHQASRIAR